jgi:hypothetical protein
MARRGPDRAHLRSAWRGKIAASSLGKRSRCQRAPHAIALPVFAQPHQQRALPLHRAARASGGAQAPRSTRETARQARSCAGEGHFEPSSGGATFAALLSIPLGGRYPPLTLSPAQQRRQTLATLLDQLEGLTRQQPILFFFEDVHWADPTSIELLDLTIDRVRHLPVLAIFTFRPEFEPPWAGLPNVTTLALERLDRPQVQIMIKQLTGGLQLPVEVMSQIINKTDGIPLFVEELTKMVLESGILIEDAADYRLDGPLPPLAIPATLQDFPDGPPRPPCGGEGDRPIGCRDRTGVLLRVATHGHRP